MNISAVFVETQVFTTQSIDDSMEGKLELILPSTSHLYFITFVPYIKQNDVQIVFPRSQCVHVEMQLNSILYRP